MTARRGIPRQPELLPCLLRAKRGVVLKEQGRDRAVWGESPRCQRRGERCVRTQSRHDPPELQRAPFRGQGLRRGWGETCSRAPAHVYVSIVDHGKESQKRFLKILLKMALNLKKLDLPGRHGKEPVS